MKKAKHCSAFITAPLNHHFTFFMPRSFKTKKALMEEGTDISSGTGKKTVGMRVDVRFPEFYEGTFEAKVNEAVTSSVHGITVRVFAWLTNEDVFGNPGSQICQDVEEFFKFNKFKC